MIRFMEQMRAAHWLGMMLGLSLLTACQDSPPVEEIPSPSIAGEVDTPTPTAAPEGVTGTPPVSTPSPEPTRTQPPVTPTATPELETPTQTAPPTPTPAPSTPTGAPPTATPVPPTSEPSTPTPLPSTPTPTVAPTPTATPDPASLDQDGDGFSELEGDCDDADPENAPGLPEVCDGNDNNCDGDADEDAVDAPTWYIDYDRDGYGGTAFTTVSCTAPAGFVTSASDCNDINPTVHPNATEMCDGIDNNCDGSVDGIDAQDAVLYYLDSDSDAYGVETLSLRACEQPQGYAPASGDCNDADPQYHPAAEESDCTDPNDYNCDGVTGFADTDGDGFAACLDCNDTQLSIYPGAEETCDGSDNNCDGTIDEDSATDATLWYLDGDQDGYGTTTLTALACSSPSGYVGSSGDCNDADPRYYPGASEADCTDPNDYSCDGSVAYADEDGDGSAACVDCNDLQPLSYPEASERCDGIDNDCDAVVDEASSTDATTWYPDADSDGYGVEQGASRACTAPLGTASASGDCDDTNPAYHPGAPEDSCTSAEDFNCDGSSGYIDADADGFSACQDCNDQNAQIKPTATETCNGVDDNCDGQADEAGASNPTTWYADSDGDTHGNASVSVQTCTAPEGYVSSSDDCNDASANAYPGAAERCDGLDNDCDGSQDEGVQSTYYADVDGDGHGSAASATAGCTAPSGYVSSSDDCGPSDASTYPGAPEGCDGQDHNCDGRMDQDRDGDGFPAATCGGTDCNDTLSSVNPGAVEACNGIDDDCDQTTDEGVKSTFYLDADGDTYGNSARTSLACSAPTADYVSRGGDCNDLDPTVYPSATEICDGADNNCNTQVDESDPDIDFETDVEHCGACFEACSNATGEAACVSGTCTVASCDPGWLDADDNPANGCEATYNYAVVGGEVGANSCNFGTTWTRVPYNHTLSITTTGNPVLFTATKRQFKSGSCERGYLTLEIDGQIIQDASGIGIGSSYECYQSAALSWVQRLPAGNHTIRLMEKTDSSSIGVCSTGATDTLLALELTPIFNFAYAQGASGSNTRNGSTSWVQAPYNSQVSLTTAGNPILLMSTKRQYKDDCNSRGYLSFDVDGQVFQDAGGIGIGSSFSCNASAFASMVTPTTAGAHTIKLVERGDSTSQGVYSMGATDTLLALELEPWMNLSMARGASGALITQYGTTWTKAPYNHTTQVTSEYGGHLLTYAVKRQYKAGSCARGYFTLDIDGTLIRDEYDTGIGSSWNCNASAPLTYIRAADAGTHRLSLMERTESSSIGNQTYGATDNMLTWELVPQDGLLGTQARPAESCRQILKNGASRGSGAYWISTPAGARQLYCDMSVDGGGWTLVGQVSTGANTYDAWLKSERNVANLSSSLIEAGTWSSINAVPMAVQVATELRLSNSAINRWVRWPLPAGRTLSTWWNHAAGQPTIDAAADQSVTVTAYSGATSTCYQSVYGIMPLVNHGGSYPSAAFNTAGNTSVSDWCMSVGTLLAGSTGNGFSQNGNGWDAPYTETDWPNTSYSVASPVISVWLR